MNSDVLSILKSYPKVYLACHVDHVRRRSDTQSLSAHDSTVLIHLTSEEGMRASELAAHMGIRPSTLSASLKRLIGLGYLEAEPASADRRQKNLILTKKGEAAIVASSVLDPSLLKNVLDQMPVEERRAAVTGLALLAKAAAIATSMNNKQK